MFGVFDGDNFVGFWANKKQDNWARITAQKLNLTAPAFFWYNKGDCNAPDFYRFDDDKNLIIQSRNEEGTLVDGETYWAETYSY